jgi:tRNA pseudouridine65 synthase
MMFDQTETLDVLFRDEHLVAVHKPAGLLVHRSEIDRHETRFAVQLVRDQIGQHVYPVHRLDKPTSGILVMALNNAVARDMTERFTSREVVKTYQALARGFVAPTGTVDHPLGRIDDDYVDASATDKQPAITHFRCLNTYQMPVLIERYAESRFSHVEIWPETGRQHQIRRHFKHLSHPLIGDVRYGRGAYNRYFREHFGAQRLMLTCTQLQFVHPVTDVTICIDCPPDASFAQVITLMAPFVTERHD